MNIAALTTLIEGAMMEITVKPIQDVDKSIESASALEEKASIAAKLAGYDSLRHFQMCAMSILVDEVYPVKIKQSPTPKKTQKAVA